MSLVYFGKKRHRLGDDGVVIDRVDSIERLLQARARVPIGNDDNNTRRPGRSE